MIQRNFIKYFLLLILITFIGYAKIVFAEEKPKKTLAKQYYKYNDAEQYCNGIKNALECADVGCEYSKENVCHAIKCGESIDCSSLNYCDYDKSKTSPLCVRSDLLTCQYYSNCLSTDNNGHICDTSKCNSYSVIDDINKSYVPSDSAKYCRMLYDSKNVKASRNTATRELCDSIAASSYKGNFDYQACVAGELTLGDIYNSLCVDPDPNGNKCSSDQYSYYLNVGGQFGGYHCECLYGRDSKGNCKNYGGGGIGKCSPTYDYVKNGYNMDCTSDSCVKADCNISANPMDANTNRYYNPQLQIFDGDNNVRAYNVAYMYTGTCNGKDTDVYCIDPSAKYHDNSAGYKCNAALNEEGVTDAGFVKIYQQAINKYKDDMNIKNAPLSLGTNTAQEYAGIHMAFRYWTFYSGFGINEDSREHNQNIAKAFSGTSYYIAQEYDFSLKNGDYKNWTFKTLYKNSWKIAVGKDNETSGYKDAVEFFKNAAKNTDIWENPLEFVLVSRSEDKKTATIRLNNIDELIDSRYIDWNFVKNISCTDVNGQNGNCEILTPLDEYLLNNGKLSNAIKNGYIEFQVRVLDVSKTFTLSVKYYDRRDAKNIIIATASNNKGSYQRLLFVASEPRDFIYDKTFGTNSVCSISNGKYYHEGKNVTKEEFLDSCCGELSNSTLSRLFCQLNSKSSVCKNGVVDSNWINNQCSAACSPTNTTDKCTNTETGTKDIYISDLTEKEGSLYEPDSSTDKYCYTCAYGGDLTGKTDAFLASDGNKYCAIYCVKEYKFTVPTNLGVNGDLKYGRYLSIGVAASGTQTCFTGEINTTLFETDYKNAKEAAQAAIDEYNWWKENVDYSDESKIGSSDATCSKSRKVICPDGYVNYQDSLCVDYSKPTTYNPNEPNGQGGYGVQHYETQSPTIEEGCTGGTYTSYSRTIRYNGKDKTFSSNGHCNSECDSNPSSGSKNDVKDQIKQYIEVTLKNNMIKKVNELNNIISTYNGCSTFSQRYDFNPQIEFTYEEEPYNTNLSGRNYLVGASSTTEPSYQYYQDRGSCGFTKEGLCEKQYASYTCEGDNCKATMRDSYCNKYVKTTQSGSATLTPQTYWCTKVGNGSAFIKNGTTCGNNANDIGNVYPLSRNCGKDKNDYRYGMKITNLGNVETVLSSVSGTNINNNLEYACGYHVNNKSCEGCESLYYYRSISLNDMFTKVTEFHDMNQNSKKIVNKVNGVEKKVSTGARVIYDYTWSSEKGQATKNAIESLGEETYTKEHLQYSYELTPAGMKVIREYNDKVETIEAGGYGDFNLKCNGYNCISDFLNDIENKKYQGVISLKRYTDFTPYDGKPWK